jgi:hypothetical protein
MVVNPRTEVEIDMAWYENVFGVPYPKEQKLMNPDKPEGTTVLRIEREDGKKLEDLTDREVAEEAFHDTKLIASALDNLGLPPDRALTAVAMLLGIVAKRIDVEQSLPEGKTLRAVLDVVEVSYR